MDVFAMLVGYAVMGLSASVAIGLLALFVYHVLWEKLPQKVGGYHKAYKIIKNHVRNHPEDGIP